MRKHLSALIAVLLLLLTGGTATADGFPRAVKGTAPSLHPEGIAWDPTRGAFLVGSLPHGTVSVVRPDGSTRTLIRDNRMASTLGVHVDAVRNRVLVAYQSVGQPSGLGIFDLRSGQPLHVVPLGTTPNDLAIDWLGNAYVTDPGSDAVHRVDVRGRVTTVVRDPRLGSPTFGLNGIVWHPAGYLLAVRYDNGKLLRISLREPGRIDEVALDRPLVGGDGMAVRPDGALVVVTNHLGADGEDAVTVLRPRGLWSGAEVVRRVAWPVEAPTTVAVTPHGSYVLNGLLNLLILQGKTSDEFHLTRV